MTIIIIARYIKSQTRKPTERRALIWRLQKATSQHTLTSHWRHTCPLVIRLIRREIGLRKQGGGADTTTFS